MRPSLRFGINFMQKRSLMEYDVNDEDGFFYQFHNVKCLRKNFVEQFIVL